MSATKECKVLHKIFIDSLEKEITSQLSRALRADFPNVKKTAGKIAEQVEISMETIIKWYHGYNTPSAAHLIILARANAENVWVWKNKKISTAENYA